MARCVGFLGAWLALLPVAFVAAESPSPSHADAFSKEGLVKADVSQLKDTQLVAHPDVTLAKDENVIWCGTLQLAWNKAIDLVGEKLTFENPPPLVALLNREDFTAAELSADSYVAIADFERNHVEAEIRAALEKTFHGAAAPELIPPVPADPGPFDFVAYAYLYKNLAFTDPFSDNEPISFGGTPVKNFGFMRDVDRLPAAVLQQVTICDYQSRDDLVIKLKTKAVDDELILAKVPPGSTLQATINSVLKRAAAGDAEPAGKSDRMAIPKLNFDLKKDFNELQGLILTPSPSSPIKTKLRLEKAQQLVRFQLNEKGAVLKSEAVITMRALAMAPGHQLIFDQPFLILMKQSKASGPYFAMWVGNASLLVPVK
jgi:hypothetical protein